MDDFRNNYGEFMKDLIPFVDLVSQRYKRGAPHALQYVKLIPIIMKTTDRDLVTGRIDQVVDKFKSVRFFTLHVFKYLELYVQDEFKEWVKSQIKKLDWWLEHSEYSLSEAKNKNEKPAVVVTSAGISGTNRGVSDGVSDEDWYKLAQLYNEIQTNASQMRG
ncbi:hypothetical protein BsWGS_04183 [Bradybaena similaris]